MMAAGNPNWWSINTTTMQQSHESSPPPPPHASHEYFYGSNSSTADHHHHHSNNQDFPRSWSQLLLGGGGLEGSELLERFVSSSPFQYKKLEEEEEKWEDQILNPSSVVVDLIKQESVAPTTTNYDDQFHGSNYTNTHSWSPLIMPPPPPLSSSSSSVVTSLSTSLLNFSGTATQSARRNNNNSYHHPPPDQNSSECNSSSAGGVLKKPKIQHSSSTQPILKVRKEKLGDRITALHQLVSPFGKTDTASVLSEAIGYIRFLQAQIEALSSPYMGNVSAAGSMGHQHQSEESLQDLPNDLRTRGLCLVPVSCIQQIGSETGADYWAPALGGGF